MSQPCWQQLSEGLAAAALVGWRHRRMAVRFLLLRQLKASFWPCSSTCPATPHTHAQDILTHDCCKGQG